MSVEVKQSDREAAAKLLGGACPDGLLEGGKDTLSLIQTLAAHRHQAEEAMRERAAKVAEEWKSSLRPGSIARLAGHDEAARDIAAAIRSIDTRGE